jgi:hypothetical protein
MLRAFRRFPSLSVVLCLSLCVHFISAGGSQSDKASGPTAQELQQIHELITYQPEPEPSAYAPHLLRAYFFSSRHHNSHMRSFLARLYFLYVDFCLSAIRCSSSFFFFFFFAAIPHGMSCFSSNSNGWTNLARHRSPSTCLPRHPRHPQVCVGVQVSDHVVLKSTIAAGGREEDDSVAVWQCGRAKGLFGISGLLACLLDDVCSPLFFLLVVATNV